MERYKINANELLERITANPEVKVGKPVIKGTRLPVEFILKLLANGITISEILEEYTHIQEADIHACLFHAHKVMEDVKGMPVLKVEDDEDFP